MRIKLNMLFILFLFASIYLGFVQQSLILFSSVILHELGHVFAAKKLRVDVESVELFPFGGVARMEDLSKYGGLTELVIATAGPVVSGLLALLTWMPGGESEILSTCAKYNFIIFIFNLIPALPLDGGRVVRNLLSLYTSFKAATRIMVLSGRLIALALVIYNIILLTKGGTGLAYLITAVFIYTGTVMEMRFCSYYYLLNKSNHKVRAIRNKKIRTREIIVYRDTYIRFAARQFSTGNYCIIKVMDESGKVMRVLNEADIMDGFLKYGYDAKIEDILK